MFIKLLEEIQRKGIKISFSDGKLTYSGPEEAITPEFLSRLKEHKAKLIKYFWPLKESNFSPINAAGTKSPFIMVHGELANYFLSETLQDLRPFYAFLHLGSEGERIKHSCVDDFVKDYLEKLEVVLPNGPFLLGGYSFGGFIAFELACIFQSRGFEVPFLALVDCIPPNFDTYNIEKANPKVKGSIIKRLINLFLKYYWKVFFVSRRKIWNLLTILPIKLKPELRKEIIIDRYSQLLKKYHPKQKFKGEIILYVAKYTQRPLDDYKKWIEYCDDLKIIELEGDHETIMKVDESIFKFQNTFREHIEKIPV